VKREVRKVYSEIGHVVNEALKQDDRNELVAVLKKLDEVATNLKSLFPKIGALRVNGLTQAIDMLGPVAEQKGGQAAEAPASGCFRHVHGPGRTKAKREKGLDRHGSRK
jgi:hypothetical protein